MKSMKLGLSVLLLSAFVGTVGAQEEEQSKGSFSEGGGSFSGSVDSGEKDLRVRDAPDQELRVSLRLTNQPVVGGKVNFRIKGNDDFFLYLFTVSKRTGRAYMVLPNAIQTANKYSGGMPHNVPNSNVELYSDSEGYEKVVYVASRKYIPWDTNGYKQVGDFLELGADELDKQIEKQIVLGRPSRASEQPRQSSRNTSQYGETQSNRYYDDEYFVGELDFYVRSGR